MTSETRSADLLPLNHPLVDQAMQAVDHLSSDERDKVLRSFFHAFATYAETKDIGVLERVSADAMTTARLHSSGGYRKLYEQAPTVPARTGHSVKDVLSQLRG